MRTKLEVKQILARSLLVRFCFLFFLLLPDLIFSDADKGRELGEAHAEIKALRLSERQREKAVEEV